MGGAGLGAVAACMGVAGVASAAAVALGGVGLFQTRGAGQLLSAVAMVVGGSLVPVIVLFLLSIR